MKIPEMTNPLGIHWRQPKKEDIKLAEDTAEMSQSSFDMLMEYPFSTPSGVYAGKMWKRKFRGHWLLCFYKHREDTLFDIVSIPITVVQDEPVQG